MKASLTDDIRENLCAPPFVFWQPRRTGERRSRGRSGSGFVSSSGERAVELNDDRIIYFAPLFDDLFEKRDIEARHGRDGQVVRWRWVVETVSGKNRM